jgi:hypothetical protein
LLSGSPAYVDAVWVAVAQHAGLRLKLLEVATRRTHERQARVQPARGAGPGEVLKAPGYQICRAHAKPSISIHDQPIIATAMAAR